MGMLKVYEDIINDVISRLEEDADSVGISRSQVYELRNDWKGKLIEYAESEWLREDIAETCPQPSFCRVARPQSDCLDEGYEDELSDMVSSDEVDLIEDKNPNHMICLYVKVNKCKNRWKCVLKQGFINIGSVEFAFNSAHGELEW